MLWNIDRSNVPTAPVTRQRIDLGEAAETRAIEPHVQEDLPELPCARVLHRAHQGIMLPDRHTDRRTQILNLFIILTVLNFVLNIYILRHLVTIRFF